MSLILAVDTTAEFGSIALARVEDRGTLAHTRGSGTGRCESFADARGSDSARQESPDQAHGSDTGRGADFVLVEEVLIHSPEGFSRTLFEHIERLLNRHGIRPGDIECFATAAGPGSFTGVRVGLAAVKGLAEALTRPVVAVSNLQALAACGSAALRAAIIDARRGDVYGAVYDCRLRPVVPETVTKFQSWLATLPEGDLEFVTTDFGPFRAAITATRFESATVTEQRALSAAIARIAADRLTRGETDDPAAPDANYVRRSDAELLWRDPR